MLNIFNINNFTLKLKVKIHPKRSHEDPQISSWVIALLFL